MTQSIDWTLHRMEAYVDTWDAVQLQITDLFEKRGRLEMEMMAGMKAVNAEEFSRNGITVTYKVETEWVEGALDPLAKVLQDEGKDPEQFLNKPVARKYDKRKLKKLAKQGGHVREIIEGAQVELSPVLKIRRSKSL